MKRHAHNFTTLNKVARQYYGDKGYCGVICLAASAQIGFGKARAELERQGRRKGQGTNMYYLRNAGQKYGVTAEAIRPPRATLGACFKALPKTGVYWIHTTRHITCVEDGAMIDWADDSRRHKVVAVYQITRNFTPIERIAA